MAPRATPSTRCPTQPFAALLLNGFKTLETRNNELFAPYEGRRVVVMTKQLRGASRRWRDTWRHRRDVDVARDANANNAKIIKDGRRKSTLARDTSLFQASWRR